jgi:hypothetical protein
VPSGKGRPTPKRSVAEKRRAPVAAPTNRRDAARLARQQRANKRNDVRKALVAGNDERALPARDRGPVRRYVRDWVDARRTLSEFMLPLIVILWLPSLFTKGSTQALLSSVLTAVVLVLLLELVVMMVLLRRAVDRTFPDGGPGRRGAMRYGGMRLAALRMFRLPKPAVRRGDEPRPVR